MPVPAELIGDQGDPEETPETPVADQGDEENKGAADEGDGDQGAGAGGEGDEGKDDEGQPAAKLYKLPDGREVDADTLAKEFQENFLPDYTKKSQRLAEIDQAKDPSKINATEKKADRPWKDPDWVPANSQELLEAAVEKFYEDIETRAQAEKSAREEVAKVVEDQLTQIKTKDPKVDENALFVHANKYKFTDLLTAWENMQELKGVVTKTEQRVVKNMKTREADPVAGGQDGGAADEGIDYEAVRAHGGAMGAVQDYLERTSKK